MFKIKFLLIISAILIFASVYSNSQTITFSARSTETGFSVKLDSVKIIDQTNHITITTNNNYADLSKLTSVNSDDSKIFDFFVGPNFPNPFDINTKISVTLQQTSPVLIKLFNFLGQAETEFRSTLPFGKHIFQINGEGLMPGLYFILVNDGMRQQVVKLIKNNFKNRTEVSISYINAIQIENKIPILNNSIYEFIGFANNYSSDTLKVPYPKNGDVYEFLLDSIHPNLKFKSGIIKFGGMSSINERNDYLQSSAPGESYNKFWVDTTVSNYSSDLKSCDFQGDGYNQAVFICRHVKSMMDTVLFCCYKGLNDEKGENPSYNYIKLIVDTNSNSIKYLYFFYQNYSYKITYPTNEVLENSDGMYFSYNNNIQYTTDNNKNLHAIIKGNISEKDLDFRYDSKSDYRRLLSNYARGGSCTSKKLTNFDDNSFISIDLYP